MNTNPDVLIIGAGSAGLAAALSAAQAGAAVQVIDKSDIIGGPCRINPSSLGMFAVESWMQQELHTGVTCEDVFRRLMEHTRWEVDARVVSALVRNSAPTIEWFNALGVDFDNVVAYYNDGLPVWHIRNDPFNPVIADVLEEHSRKLGVDFSLNTTARSLIVEEGKVRGCTVTTPEGDTVSIHAASTIIATGGYQGSPELIHEYTGLTPGVDLFTFEMFTHPVHQGEGIKMALEVGAAPAHTMLETYIYLPDPCGGPGGTATELSSFRQPNLMVNQHGQRFVDESIVENPADASNTVKAQPGRRVFMILTDPIDAHYREHGLDFQLYGLYHHPGTLPPLGDMVRLAVDSGYEDLFHADTLDELAALTGMPADQLRQTVAEYDEACARGVDGQFFKHARYLRPLGEGPYYAAKFCLGSYGSSGGITVNEHGQVLDKAGLPIDGLYASGRDANSIYGGTYPFFMAGAIQGFSYTMGRLCGTHAANAAGHHEDTTLRAHRAPVASPHGSLEDILRGKATHD